MQLVERHIIKENHKLFKECDKLSFLSKNLYNIANYTIRQEFIKNNKYISFGELDNLFITTNQIDYRNLPAKVSKGILRILDRNWSSFFESKKDLDKKGLLTLSKTNISVQTKINYDDLHKASKKLIDYCLTNKIGKIVIGHNKICKHDEYCGKRIKRGLFQTKNGYLINADINGAFNILRKAVPIFDVNSLSYGIEGFAVNPLTLKIIN
jgi:putative transposase